LGPENVEKILAVYLFGLLKNLKNIFKIKYIYLNIFKMSNFGSES